MTDAGPPENRAKSDKSFVGKGATRCPACGSTLLEGPPRSNHWKKFLVRSRDSGSLQEPMSETIGVRFNIVSLFPSLFLILLIACLLGTGVPSQTPSINRLLDNIKGLGTVEIVALLLLGFLLALLTHPFQFALVQLLEGYWGSSRLALLLSEFAAKRYRRRHAKLRAAAENSNSTSSVGRRQRITMALLRTYPPKPERILPTKLGNALRAAEDRAGDRYGFSTVTIMPYIYPYLSDRLLEAFNDIRNQLDTAARLCVVLLVAAFIYMGLLVPLGFTAWFALPLILLILSWISYRAAIRAALSYGRVLHMAFDLHRFDLLTALHYPLPRNIEEQHDLARRISLFFAVDVPVGVNHYHESEESHREDAQWGRTMLYQHPALDEDDQSSTNE
jgi:hypothetical protein